MSTEAQQTQESDSGRPEDVKPEAVEVKEQKFQLTKKVSGARDEGLGV